MIFAGVFRLKFCLTWFLFVLFFLVFVFVVGFFWILESAARLSKNYLEKGDLTTLVSRIRNGSYDFFGFGFAESLLIRRKDERRKKNHCAMD